MARLTADMFVSALIRRVFSDGGAAAIERRGAFEAGAIFVRARHRDRTETLLTPAPQTAFDTDRPEDRVFEVRLSHAPEFEVGEVIARERRFDPDIWVVEIETETPETYLTIVASD